MKWQQGRAEIDQMLADGELERVQASREHADRLVNQAQRHLDSAQATCTFDPEGAEAQHRHQAEVVEVGGLSARGEHGFELEVAEAKRRGLGGDSGATYVLRGRVLEQTVDDTRAVEPGHDRESARDGGWLVAANLLHPAHEQLDVRALSCHGV